MKLAHTMLASFILAAVVMFGFLAVFAQDEPTPTALGMFVMHTDADAVWFTPPASLPDVEYDVTVTFCRASQPMPTEEAPDYTEPYGMVPAEEGEALAAELFTGRIVPYPWMAATAKEDGAIPRTQLERTFLKLVLSQLEAKNDLVTDAAWLDPRNRLGVAMTASSFVEPEEGATVYRMLETTFYLFPRGGQLTILAEDDLSTWTLSGDTSLEWPR